MRFAYYLALAIICMLPMSAFAARVNISQSIFTVTFEERDRAAAEAALRVLVEAKQEFNLRLPAGTDPIHVQVAPTMNEFLHLAGGTAKASIVGFARPFQSIIVVKSPRFLKPNADFRGTMRHELVHVLLHRNIETAWVPAWLNEGLAMMLANEHRWASSFRIGRMFLGNQVIQYKDLEFAFLAPGDEMVFNNAYAQALSMTRFMRDTLGEKTFWTVVMDARHQPFADALQEHGGMSVLDFWNRYMRSLWLVTLIGALTSGSLFTPAAILVIIVWFKRRYRDRRVLKQWALEEAVDDALQHVAEPEPIAWDDVAEDPDAWKHNNGEDEDP